MKKVALFSVIIVMITLSISHAAIITVDNKTPSVGDYTTLQAAHDAANDGDTLYVYPSGVAYSAITVTKSLRFVGCASGEGLNRTLINGTMTFNVGSGSSSLEGFTGYLFVTIHENNITIKRNSMRRINVSGNHFGTVILQNALFHDRAYEYIITVDNSNELLIANNRFVKTYGSGGGCISANDPTTTITILHNVMSTRSGNALYVNDSNKFVANNIIVIGGCSGCRNSSGYYYNMAYSSNLPEGNGNIGNVDMNTVFVNPDGYDFHLLPDSPAIGAGQNGVDMGIYGGSTAYVDDRAPGLPSIFYLKSDHMGSQSQGLDVTIKAKSNKE